MRQASRMLDQSPYVNQLVCAVGGVLVFIAKSEWRGGEQKKLEKLEFDMPNLSNPLIVYYVLLSFLVYAVVYVV